MSRTRRKILIRIIQKVALTLALLDVVLYFAAVRPLDNLATQEWQHFNSERRRVQESQVRIARLQRSRTALPSTTQQLGAFTRDHIPSRRQGFSRAARLVQRLTNQSGVRLADAPSYHLDWPQGEPFEHLGIELGVVGSFSSVLQFVHALETARDFILVRGLNLTSAEGSTVELRVTADLYLSP